MKKHLNTWLLAVLTVLVVACSKNEVAPVAEANYFFSFKENGVERAYVHEVGTANMSGDFLSDSNTGTKNLTIIARKTYLAPNANAMSFLLADTAGVVVGVNYNSAPEPGAAYPDYAFMMGYHNNAGNLYLASGFGTINLGGLYRPAFLELTEVSGTAIAGKFSGILMWYDTSGGTNVLMDSVVISDGRFRVPR